MYADPSQLNLTGLVTPGLDYEYVLYSPTGKFTNFRAHGVIIGIEEGLKQLANRDEWLKFFRNSEADDFDIDVTHIHLGSVWIPVRAGIDSYGVNCQERLLLELDLEQLKFPDREPKSPYLHKCEYYGLGF